MKNLIVFSAAGMGDRYSAAAPTFWTTMNGFVKAGWQVWVFNASAKEGVTNRVDYPDGLHLIQQAPPWRKQTQIKKIGHAFALSQLAWIRRWQRKQAEALIAKEGLDKTNTVIYGAEGISVLAAADIHTACGLKLVTRFFGIWDMFTKPYTWKNRILCYPKFDAYRVAADLTIMTNDGTQGDKMLRRVGNEGKNIVFWRNGVDIPDPKQEAAQIPGLEPGDKVLITLSRLHPGKRVDRAIRALAEVRRTHPEAKLLICGYGDEEKKLKRITEEENLQNAVIFTGGISHDQVFSYLKRGDIFLSFYEASNLGNPLFEAMRCGLPVIASDVGETKTVVIHGQNGLLLSGENLEEEIPRAICRLLEDEDLRKRLGQGSLRFAQENFWTWEERVQAEIDAVGALLAPDRE
ncbi:MAG: glycosyltransferase family 4 protein [Oscillospiraceae bacterium]|nr:glycosyltransferase family 4 protein [Oscillospiraceae bacterium]